MKSINRSSAFRQRTSSLVLAFVVVVGAMAAHAQTPRAEKDRVAVNSFEADPSLKISKGESDPVHKLPFIEAVLEIPSTDQKSFQFECELNIEKFNSYGEVWIGLAGFEGERVEVALQRGDDGIPTAFPLVSMGPAQVAEPSPAKGLRDGICRFFIEYNTFDNSVRWTINDDQGAEIYASKPVIIGGRLALDKFFIRVIEKDDIGVSDIYFNPGGSNIFFRSQIGHEGPTPYVIEGSIDAFTLTYFKE